MTTWFSSRRRAEDFAARLDGSRPGPHGAPGPTTDAGTERLLALAGAVQAHGAMDPSATPGAAFTRDLRDRLMAEAPTVLTAERPAEPGTAPMSLSAGSRRSRERRLVAAATAAVILGGGVGAATASRNSLPGDTLYPLKRALEHADVALSGSPNARGRDLLDQATHRLDESRALLRDGDGTNMALVPATLRAFTDESREGADLLLASYRDDQGPTPVLTVRRFAAASYEALGRLSADAPRATQPVIADAMQVLGDIDARAGALCSTCADLPDLGLSPASLESADGARARAELNAARLEKSRPSLVHVPVRKALERAATPASSAEPASAPEVSPETAHAASGPSRHASAPAPTPAASVAPAPTAAQALPAAPAAPTVAPRDGAAASMAKPPTSPSAPVALPSSAPSVGPSSGSLANPLSTVSAPDSAPKPPQVTKAPRATVLPGEPALRSGAGGALGQ